MANSRHKHARSHKHAHHNAHAAAHRRRQLTRLVLPALGLITLVGTSTAVVATNAADPVVAQVSSDDGRDVITSALSEGTVSRSAERAPVPNEAAADDRVNGRMYVIATDAIDVYADANESSPRLAVLAPDEPVAVTGKKRQGWTEIMHKDAPRWVKSSGLVKEQELSSKPCPDASENGLQPDTIKVIRAVCAKFPDVQSYGGTRGGGGDHATGRAVDIMVGSNSVLGDQIAAFVQKNAAELGVEYIIWQQRIWRPATSSSWRGMSDRGSPTANHMDHPHVNT